MKPAPPPSEIELVASERAKLLARKYNKGLSAEEQEKLSLLTARLNELCPPVRADDLRVLADILDDTKRIREHAQEIRRRLGLS